MCVGLGAYPVISRPTVGEGPTDLVALDKRVPSPTHSLFSSHSYSKMSLEMGQTRLNLASSHLVKAD